MRLLALLLTVCLFSNNADAQTYFQGDVHQVDLDIMETTNSCFRDFGRQEIDYLLIFDQALRRYDLHNQYKMIGIFKGQNALGVFMLIDKKYYQIMPGTIETYSDIPQSRILLMRHHNYGTFQLVQLDESLKNGVSLELRDKVFMVSNYRNGLPNGKQYVYNLITDEITTKTANIVPVVGGDLSQMWSDTIEVMNQAIQTNEGFIVERTDSTSVFINN